MKKLSLALSGLILVLFSSLGMSAEAPIVIDVPQAKIEDKVQYVTLDKLPSPSKEIIQFFSFYCGTCAMYYNLGVIEQLNAKLPPDVKVTQYHVDFMGGASSKLSRAWVVAKILGVQEKIEPIIFDRVQKTKNLSTDAQIRDIFLQVGVTAEEYDSLQDNFLVKGMLLQQAKAAEEMKVSFVPSIFVNGKYLVRQGGLDSRTNQLFIDDYARVVNFLLNKDK